MIKPYPRPSRRVALKPGALRRAREERGLTLILLADHSGVSYSHLAAIEKGRDGISPPALARVALALGVTVADLRSKEHDNGTTPPA